ncbi:MAG: ABC transporter permease [Dokdonella sp.]
MLRDAWLHKARTLLVVLAIATGLVAAGALLDAWALVQHVTDASYRASLPVSATLQIDSVDADALAAVRALPTIAAARARRSVLATAQINGAHPSALLFALDDYSSQEIARLQPETGEWPPRDGSIVIERSSLTFSAASVGQAIALTVGDKPPQALTVSGIARDVSLAPGWMENLVYGFVSPGTLVTLGLPAGFHELQIRVRDATADRDAIRRIAYEVKTLLERSGHTVTNVDVPLPGQHIHAPQMDSLILTQGAFSLLTLLVCGFLIINLITATLASQVREIGVMKSFGAQTGQLVAMYLGFALLIGVLATLLALLPSLLIGRAYAALKGEMLNFPIDGYAIPAWAIALQLVVGALLPVIAASLPVLRGCRLSVSAALRDTGIACLGANARRQRMIGVGHIGRPLLLSIGNAFRRRQRLLLTLLVLASGGAVYLGAANLRESVSDSVGYMFSMLRYDVSLRFSSPYPPAQIEAVASAVAGVRRAETWDVARANIDFSDGTRSGVIALIGLPADSTLVEPRLIEGHSIDGSDRKNLVVSSALLKHQPGLTIGSTLALIIDGKPSSWSVIGVVESGPQKLAYTSRAALAFRSGAESATTLVIATTPRGVASQLDVTQRLRAALVASGMPVANSQRPAESQKAYEDHMLMVVQFLGVMGWVMIAVGGMGLASTMSLGVLERTREIGVLRAIGARHRDIMLMLQVECMVIALLGWLVSIPLSVPMSSALGDAFGRIMFELPPNYMPNGEGVVRWLAMIVVVSILACAWPALRATRISAATALSYE